jgi:hypothetical protein
VDVLEMPGSVAAFDDGCPGAAVAVDDAFQDFVPFSV